MDFIPIMNRASSVAQSMTLIAGRVVTSTSGTISTQDVRGGGVVVTKTGGKTGRYTFTLQAGTNTPVTSHIFLGLYVNIIGPDDTAISNSKGIVPFIRDIDIGEGADDGTVEIQFVISTATAQADTELADAAGFTFLLVLGNKVSG
jgi:hypothetical protein